MELILFFGFIAVVFTICFPRFVREMIILVLVVGGLSAFWPSLVDFSAGVPNGVGIVIVLVVCGVLIFKYRHPVPAKTADKVCPFCAENIKGEALVCRYCNRDLPKVA